jgi:alpha-1,3-rhamnosyl/mannosyltransferase
MCSVLDARTATDHFPGIGRYVVNLVQAMVPLLGESERLNLLYDRAQPVPAGLTALSGGQVGEIAVPYSPFSIGQQWSIPRLLRHLGADVYHSPYYLMPYCPGVPTLVTVYDLIPLRFPQYTSARARLLFRWSMALALRAASHVIVISEATRRDLLAFFHLSPQDVTVISLAAAPSFRPPSPAEVQRVRHKYGLRQDYVLYLGINKPHKNLVRLVEAWSLVCHSRFATRGSPLAMRRSQLVIAGKWDARYPESKQRVAALRLQDAVRFLGPVAEEDLPALYGGAALFAFPSECEGFGLPVLEAMACGTPVVCANASSLPEVGGDAALYFDPANVEAMAEALGQALADADLRTELRERGLCQAAHFSWKWTAQKTLDLYGQMIGPP